MYNERSHNKKEDIHRNGKARLDRLVTYQKQVQQDRHILYLGRYLLERQQDEILTVDDSIKQSKSQKEDKRLFQRTPGI